MHEQGQSVDDVETTPHYSKVYGDASATRSPLLTVFLAILILAILTLGALAAVHWYQRRVSAASENGQTATLLISHEMYNRPPACCG
jgi:hypothetical protein